GGRTCSGSRGWESARRSTAASSPRGDEPDGNSPATRGSCSRRCRPKPCRLDYMQRRAVFVLAAALWLTACSSKSNQRNYAVHGQVVAVTPDRQEAMVKHGEIAGLMPAMTMPYKIKQKAELDAVKPGDVIDATLTIVENDAYLTGVKKVGEAPLEEVAPEPATVTTGKGLPLLQPGEVVPDSPFVDQ